MKPLGGGLERKKTLTHTATEYKCAVGLKIVDADFDELLTAAKTFARQASIVPAEPADAVAAFGALRGSGFAFDADHVTMLEALEHAIL